MTSRRGSVRVFASTGRGSVRSANEDAVLVFEWCSQSPRSQLVELRSALAPPLVCAVADGLGGHAGGSVASRVALRHIAAGYPEWPDVDSLSGGLASVSAKVHSLGCQSADTTGMGTTVAGLVLHWERILCFNVGDSRVYQVTDGYAEQLSTDDAVLDAAGEPTSTVTQAVGDPQPITAHVTEVPYEPHLRFVVCTDGVTGVIEPSSFRKLCRQRRLERLVVGLRDAAFEEGAPDNLSIVALDVRLHL